MKFKKQTALPILIIIAVMAAIPLTILLVRQRQEIRQRAAVVPELAITPLATTYNLNDPVDIDITIDSLAIPITGTEIYITYDPTLLRGENIRIADNPYLPIEIVETTAVDNAAGIATITLLSDPETPASGAGKLASMTFTAIGLGRQILIGFGANTGAATVGSSTNVIEEMKPLFVSIETDATPTPDLAICRYCKNNSECQTNELCSEGICMQACLFDLPPCEGVPIPVCVSPSPNILPSPGLVCGSICFSNIDCETGLECYFPVIGLEEGICRNLGCAEDQDCICSTESPTPVPSASIFPSPTPTPFATMIPSPTSLPTVVPACGEVCFAITGCASGLECYFPVIGLEEGICRNPVCLEDEDCICASASPTPNASAVGPAGIIFTVKFEGVTTQKTQDKFVKFVFAPQNLLPVSFEETLRMQSNTDGSFTNIDADGDGNPDPLYNDAIEPGIYDIYVNGPLHLTKTFHNITVAYGVNTIDLTSFELLAGDSIDDNIVDTLDFNQFILNFGCRPGQDTPPGKVCAPILGDYDFDLDVDIFDFHYIVANYNLTGDIASVTL